MKGIFGPGRIGHPVVHRLERQVRLVDDDDRGVRFLAAGKRLYGTDLNWLALVCPFMDPLNHADAMDPFDLERGDGLVDQ